MSDQADTMQINAMARLAMSRLLIPMLIDSHPQQDVPMGLLRDFEEQCEKTIRSSEASPQQKASARECLAELRLLRDRLTRFREGAKAHQEAKAPNRSAPSAQARRDTPDRERD